MKFSEISLPTEMTEEMLVAAHEAANASRHLPWREAERMRWDAILSAAPQQDDASRLVWAMGNMSSTTHRDRFAAYVLNVGGTGDLGDCRAYIDSVLIEK